ncbi:hypothetical protein [Luteimonas sp. 3794]|uniref:hypothetical protein n=1 Tax=Luteimonas sp. 3794 TaxID=2817730 RepID=UPI0028596B11|nr:hypothetical protein [Luteimonas sp. 3794]MDR6990260.1 hypothetical protein [Luteimonas sp. 3794]
MRTLIHAAGCCLLIVAPTGCAQQAAAPAATPTETTAETMDETSKRVAEVAAEAHGWQVAVVVVTDVPNGAAGACRLVGVRSNNVLSASTKTYAVPHDHEVVGRGEADALARVLDACGDEASPALWAEAVAAFGEGVPSGRVPKAEANISSDAHRGAIERGGYSFHPPQFAADGTVEFFMTDVEGGQLFEVRAAHGSDGAIDSAVKPAGRG